MRLLEHLLTVLAEEGAEVCQRVTKAMRFGLEEVQPGQKLTNAERIRAEVVDLLAMYELLAEGGHLPPLANPGFRMPIMDGIASKQQKVAEFILYAWQQDKVELPECPECGKAMHFVEGHPENLQCGLCRQEYGLAVASE